MSHIQYDNTYLRAAVVSDSGIFIVFGSNFGVIYSTWHITQLNHSMCHTESWAKKKKKKFESYLQILNRCLFTSPHTHNLCVSPPCRSWPWSTSTVTSVWTRPARRTARCPASETAHTRAPNSGYSATSHCQKSSDHSPFTHKHTHSHTQRPRVSNQGNGQCLLQLGTRKVKTSHEGILEERRMIWTVLPLPEIRGRSVFDPPQSETRWKTPSRRRWLLFHVHFCCF